jgi:DNA-binding MarR family transcriptional regulator
LVAKSQPPQTNVNPAQTSAEQLQLRLLRALRKLIRAVDTDSRRLAADHDITGPQLICLRTIAEHAPLTASDIAQRIHLSPSTVVGILDRLEAKKLITRERNQQDRRLIHIHPTDAGHALIARTPFPLHSVLSGALAALSPAEQQAACAALERLTNQLDKIKE